jgi:hypothetical protein
MRLEVQDRSEIDRFDIDETLMKSRIHQKRTRQNRSGGGQARCQHLKTLEMVDLNCGKRELVKARLYNPTAQGCPLPTFQVSMSHFSEYGR